MSTIKKLRKYDEIEWRNLSGPFCPKEYKDLVKDFRVFVKKSFPDCELEGFRANHFDTSGFVYNPRTDKYVYISLSDARTTKPLDKILYRTAEGVKDYTGGCNRFTSLEGLVESATKLLS